MPKEEQDTRKSVRVKIGGGSDEDETVKSRRSPRKRTSTKDPDEKEEGTGKTAEAQAETEKKWPSGTKVLVKKSDGSGEFVAGKVVRVHRSGEVTVKYDESGETERYIKLERLKKRRTASSANSKEDEEEEAKEEDTKKKKGEDEEEDWKQGDAVEYKAKDSSRWKSGTISRVRKDGKTVDIEHESDEEKIESKVDKENLRRPAPKRSKSTRKSKKATASSEDDDAAKDTTSSKSPRSRGGGGGSGLTSSRSGRLPRLMVRQDVHFQDDDGIVHFGKVKNVRHDDDTCDIEHQSDDETISKRIPMDQVKPVTTLTRMFGVRRSTFQLDTRVAYKSREGSERYGMIVRINKDKTYDIQEKDGFIVKKISASRMREVNFASAFLASCVDSLPQINLGFGSLSEMFSFGPIYLRKGMEVRFKRKNSETGSMEWIEKGIIVRTKPTDESCVIEYYDEDDKKQVDKNVKYRDIQPLSSLGGVLDALISPAKAVANAATHTIPSGTFVEVQKGSKTFQAVVLNEDQEDGTYTIQYKDGKKENRVTRDRLRVCLRKLRIGTEVEIIIEGPCKEISKLEGEVAWVHRDEKVAVRIGSSSESNDIFAEVSSHALMVDGQSANDAPLSSTWWELMGFYCNLLLETFVYAWFCFGMIMELTEMIQLYQSTASNKFLNPIYMQNFYTKRQAAASSSGTTGASVTVCLKQHEAFINTANNLFFNASTSYALIPEDTFFDTDRGWLLFFLVLKGIATFAVTLLVGRLIYFKVQVLQDNFIDVSELHQDRLLRRRVSYGMGFGLIICFLLILNYLSLLNHFEMFCLYTPTTSNNSSIQTLNQMAFRIHIFSGIHQVYSDSIELLLALIAKSILNLFRGMAFYLMLFVAENFSKRLLLLTPSIALTALIGTTCIASLHLFYTIQNQELLLHGKLMLTPSIDLTIALVLVSLWYASTMIRLLLATGKYFSLALERMEATQDITNDVLAQAERGEFGLQAKQEAFQTKIEIKQQELGIFKLTVLRLHQHVCMHLMTSIFGIVASCLLKEELTTAETMQFTEIQLGFSIVWLILTGGCGLYASYLRKTSPDLLSNILDY